MAFEIGRYRSVEGDEPFTSWLSALPDRQARARIILARIERLEIGNFGDCRVIRDGIGELRIDWGPGYRLCYGRDGQIIVLLCGGDKRKQDADIKKAIRLWREYVKRKERAPRARH
jgi:putative addiction module killer protein